MRSSPRILLVVVVAMALAPSTASADVAETIGENAQGVGAPCPAVVLTDHAVSGGCHMHAQSINPQTGASSTVELGLQVPLFGYIHQSNCLNQYEVHLDSLVKGYVSGFVISPGDPSCGTTLRHCNTEASMPETHPGNSGNPWRLHTAETGPGVTTMTINVCLMTGNSIAPECEGAFNVSVAQEGATEDAYRATSATRAPIGTSVCRVTGTWRLTAAVGEPISVMHIRHF